MANTVIQLRKSSTPSAIPTSLEFGELAINYADGKLYYKNTNSQIAEISGSGGPGGDSFGTVNANGVLIIADTPGDVLTLEAGQNITIVGDAVNDKITISATGGTADIGPAFNQANAARDQANTAFDKANAANVLAFNTGIGANAYAVSIGAASNSYAEAIGAAGNSYTNSVGTAGNNYTVTVGAASNNWANTISATRADASNSYAVSIGVAANNWANTKLANSTGTFAGSLTITGDLVTQGNVTLGDASTDTITLNGSTISLGNNQSIDSGTLFVDAVNNRVGIGTTAPTSNLHVIGTANITTDLTVGGNVAFDNINSVRLSEPAANVLTIHTTSTERLRVDTSGNVGIGTASPIYKLEVAGSFAAQTKSFVIDHHTKPYSKLVHGSLEGPENGVYYRGKSKKKTIELPDYWSWLVDEKTITVNLTPIGKKQDLFVKEIKDNKVIIGGARTVEYYYTVYAERKDVPKLIVEC